MTDASTPLSGTNRLYPFIWQIYLLIYICGLFSAFWLAGASVSLVLILIFCRQLHAVPKLLIAIAIFGASHCWCADKFALAEKMLQNPPVWLETKNCRIQGQIQSVQALPEKRLRISLANLQPIDKSQPALPGHCIWTWDEASSSPLPGQTVAITRKVVPANGFANNKNDGFLATMIARDNLWRIWSKGDGGSPQITGQPFFFAGLRERIKNHFIQILTRDGTQTPSQGDAIIISLLFGDKHWLEQNTHENFASASLAHTLALSGQHLGIALLLGFMAVTGARFLFPSLYLLRPRQHLIAFCALPLALVYLWLGNAPPSLIRAAAMLCIACILLWKNSCHTNVDILALALGCILILNPLAIFETGLQLSVLCVLVIFLIFPLFSKTKVFRISHSSSMAWKIWVYICHILIISFVIQLFLLPLNLILFQNPGYWFPLNLLWLPLLGLLVLPASFCGLLFSFFPWAFFQFIAQNLIHLASIPCQWLTDSLAYLQQAGWFNFQALLLPHWTMLLAFILMLAATAIILDNNACLRARIPFILTCALLLFALGPLLRLGALLDPAIRITAFDVGQGQSIAVTLPGGNRFLYDGGGSASVRFDPGKAILAPQLLANSPPYLNGVFNSHPDLDHAGGLIHILNSFAFDSFFHNGYPARGNLEEIWRNLQAMRCAHPLRAGDIIYPDSANRNIYLEVLWPPKNTMPEESINNSSLVMRLVRNNEGIVLLTGDVEKSGLRRILDSHANLKSLIALAPHHGSDKNLLPRFYNAAQPALVVASCGNRNRYNYPGKKLKATLLKLGIPLVDTGTQGKMEIVINPDNSIEYSSSRL